MPYTKEETQAMPAEPIDQKLICELGLDEEIDFGRPLYRCQVCRRHGESNLHKYLDDCHYFDENAFVAERNSKQ